MKRYSLGLVLLMVLMLGTAAFAKFPVPDSTATFTVEQGFTRDGNTLWYFCTDTNDIGFASTMQAYRLLTLAAPLRSAYDPNLRPLGAKMYINVSAQQGPLFTTLPYQADYSGVWSVIFIRFLPGQARRVCNLNPYDPNTNPYGFPIVAAGPTKQADLLSAYGTTRTGAVLDCPIVAVGAFPKSGPWFPGGTANANPSNFYRLQQVIAYNACYKTVTLPAWYVYCQDFITRYINRCTVIIPDAQTRLGVRLLNANFAPGLGNIDQANVQDFYFPDGRVFGDVPPAAFINGGPVGILADVNQYPIIEHCPNGHGVQNQNRNYTPLMQLLILEHTNPMDVYNKQLCFVNNAQYAQFLVGAGILTQVNGAGRLNVPVLDCVKILPPGGACCLPCPN